MPEHLRLGINNVMPEVGVTMIEVIWIEVTIKGALIGVTERELADNPLLMTQTDKQVTGIILGIKEEAGIGNHLIMPPDGRTNLLVITVLMVK